MPRDAHSLMPHSSHRSDGIVSGVNLGSEPVQYSMFAITQNPVAAHHTIAPPTNSVNSDHNGLTVRISTDPSEILNPTAA